MVKKDKNLIAVSFKIKDSIKVSGGREQETFSACQ